MFNLLDMANSDAWNCLSEIEKDKDLVERHLRLLPRQIGAHRADHRRGRAGVQCP